MKCVNPDWMVEPNSTQVDQHRDSSYISALHTHALERTALQGNRGLPGRVGPGGVMSIPYPQVSEGERLTISVFKSKNLGPSGRKGFVLRALFSLKLFRINIRGDPFPRKSSHTTGG